MLEGGLPRSLLQGPGSLDAPESGGGFRPGFWSDDETLNSASWAELISGVPCFVWSSACLVAGVLELMGILGPVCCVHSWLMPNLLAFSIWLPLFGLAAWLRAHGVQLMAVFVALSVAVLVAHSIVLVCYWVRYMRRAREARELPTQMLLTEAQRDVAMRMGLAPPASTHSSPASNRHSSSPSPARGTREADPAHGQVVENPFLLQFGRSDGEYGFTLFIPAEEEEEAFVRVLREHAARQEQKKAGRSPSPPHGAGTPDGVSPGGGLASGVLRAVRGFGTRDGALKDSVRAGGRELDFSAPLMPMYSRRGQGPGAQEAAQQQGRAKQTALLGACFGQGMGAAADQEHGWSTSHQGSLDHTVTGVPQSASAPYHHHAPPCVALQPVPEDPGEERDSPGSREKTHMLHGYHQSSDGGAEPTTSSAAHGKQEAGTPLPGLDAGPSGSSSTAAAAPHLHGHSHSSSSGSSAVVVLKKKHRRSHSLPLSRSLHRALLPLEEREDEEDAGDDAAANGGRGKGKLAGPPLLKRGSTGHARVDSSTVAGRLGLDHQ